MLEWDDARYALFRKKYQTFNANWLREELSYLSPHVLPLPIDAENWQPIVKDFEQSGFSTVVRLPFLSEDARALVTDPAIVMADEPTGNLDSVTGEAILDLFTDLHERGLTIIVVTHDARITDRCERVVQLRDGLIESDETR